MEYLIDDKHKYAATLLAYEFIENVEYALIESEYLLSNNLPPPVSDWEDYYLIYNKKWEHKYYVKKLVNSRNFPNVSNDKNLRGYKW